MNLSLSQKKEQQTIGAKRLVLLSEEDLSDRRSSSSTDSTVKQRKVNDSKCQRTARKTSQKIWQDDCDFMDCQFSGSATDEDWNDKNYADDSSDSDPAWIPIQHKINSPPPPKLTILTNSDINETKRDSVELSQPPNLLIETKESTEEDKSSTPSPTLPKLTAIVKNKTKKRSSQVHSQPPVLIEEPISIEISEESVVSVPSPALPKLTEITAKPKRVRKKPSKPPVLKPDPVLMKFQEDQVVITSTAPPKVTSFVKKKRVEKESSNLPVLQPNSTVIKKQVEDKLPNNLKAANSMEYSPSFAGIISHNAALLEKGFDSGKFIMLKSDFKTQKSPCIWRIDGKNLLQKYEPISYNDGIAYRNISTYSSWMATNKGLYVPIEVEFSIQSKSETIVTFDRNKVMLPVEDNMTETLNDEANSMIDTFQIYLQTLISQALDSNFVKEIVKEQDEYFLTSIAVVEDHWILPKRNMLKETIKMKRPFQELLEAHPGLELRCVTSGDKSCDTCGGRNPTRSFEFQPLTYSFDTLDIMEGKPSVKTYRLCLSCTDRVLLYHELFHMRYNLFTCCQNKVKQYDQKDGPAALTLSLADQNWKSLMHRKVLLILAETQQVVSQHSSDGINIV